MHFGHDLTRLFAVLAIGVTVHAFPAIALGQAIVADHHCTDLAQVPASWITQAKAQCRLSYGHTSHGSQIISGMDEIKYPAGSLYWWDYNGTQGGLSLWDTTPSGDLGNPDRTTWATLTRQMLNGSGANRNVVMWSWCGQADCSQSEMQTYLDLMAGLRADYPNVKFIYMTGHLVGSGVEGNLHQRNQQIRAAVQATGGILLDFADLESYDPDGLHVLPLYANDNCDYWVGGQQHNWATEWCAAHPGQCTSCSCAHSQSLNCDRKARAFWWLMARLAGWPGPSQDVPGDMNCDSVVNNQDIDGFVLALFDPAGYATQYPGCDITHGDFTGEGDVNNQDIDGFVGALFGR